MTVQVEGLFPKIYVNSFPKSGTHLAILITAHMAQAQKPKHWLGSFRLHSWSDRWVPVDKIINVINGQPPGTWMMGHMGHKPEIEKAFREAGTCMLFVYRDLRDVAVSLTYHIESEDDKRFKHLDKELYRSMPTHEDRIKAVIEGIDKYPGVISRWEHYAPWLDVDWVLPVRFEDMRNDPHEVANTVVDYVVKRTMTCQGLPPLVIAENYKLAIHRAIDQMQTTEHSGSFRAGRVGDWTNEFTPDLITAFDRVGGNSWCNQLGYN